MSVLRLMIIKTRVAKISRGQHSRKKKVRNRGVETDGPDSGAKHRAVSKKKMSLLTFIRSSTLCAKVGIACTGLLRVLAWWMPFSPCQWDSRITAFMFVVLSNEGSWNMTLKAIE